MRRLIIIFLLLVASCTLLVTDSFAAIPHVMNYQGKATDKQGAPLNGSCNLTFRIYNAPTGGTAKWTETQTNIAITNGIFQVQLGSVTSLNLPFDEAYWISLEINTDGEMSPRTKLASVGYAYRAEISDNGIPTGVMMAWATDSPPTGWLLCDGSAVSRTTYANLFRVIGTTYGTGDGTTTFNLPDLRGRVPVGKSIDPEFLALGQKGGEKAHVLTVAELAPHSHFINDINPGNPSHEIWNIWSTTDTYHKWRIKQGTFEDAWGRSLEQRWATEITGSGTAHNNLQPYTTVNYIIKT